MVRGRAVASAAHDRLAALVSTRAAGWGRPKGQHHAHLYAAGDMLSACGQALYFGDATPSPGRIKKCPACWRAELEGADNGQE